MDHRGALPADFHFFCRTKCDALSLLQGFKNGGLEAFITQLSGASLLSQSPEQLEHQQTRSPHLA